MTQYHVSLTNLCLQAQNYAKNTKTNSEDELFGILILEEHPGASFRFWGGANTINIPKWLIKSSNVGGFNFTILSTRLVMESQLHLVLLNMHE